MVRALRRLIVPVGFLLVFLVLPFVVLGFGTGMFREPVVGSVSEQSEKTVDPHVWNALD